jgi:hypothetical protein
LEIFPLWQVLFGKNLLSIPLVCHGCLNNSFPYILRGYKECLQQSKYGLVDDKINEYIDKVEKEIKLRSHIIQLVKNYLQNSGIESARAGVDALHGAYFYFGSHPPQQLKPEEMHEILIELSSPLTGYLGREKGNNWKTDKFYYLRDLPIN